MVLEPMLGLNNGTGTPFFRAYNVQISIVMTNKEALRDLVADLQLARIRFYETVEIYPERPIDHFIINFNEAVDAAVDAVFGIYNDVMLQEIDGDIFKKGGER